MNLLKTILSTSVFAIASVALHAQLPAKVESFPVRDVRLTASPFKHAEDMDIRYLLGIDPDRLLAPYLKEAGLSPKAENYTNWENTGLDGHIGGHYLSALSYMYAATETCRGSSSSLNSALISVEKALVTYSAAGYGSIPIARSSFRLLRRMISCSLSSNIFISLRINSILWAKIRNFSHISCNPSLFCIFAPSN